jgi:hypothetical protein
LLRQHPSIFLPALREPYFFAYEGERPDRVFCGPGDEVQYKETVTRWEDYLKLFESAQAQAAAAVGERSAVYLYSPKAARRIRHYLPQAKLIAILRQPAYRAFSHYLKLRREGRETLDFALALRQENIRVRQNWGPAWHYRQFGFYAVQLDRYLALFPRHQLRVYLFEDWRADRLGVLRDIFRFLEVDEAFVPQTTQHYPVGRVPISRAWHNFLNRPHPVKDLIRPLFPKPQARRLWLWLRDRNLTAPRLDPQIRAELTQGYRADILLLQDLLQRDLSPWLKV